MIFFENFVYDDDVNKNIKILKKFNDMNDSCIFCAQTSLS